MTIERNLGEQPLARLLADLELTPAHLVRASTEQLTHKMVSRATKGRRLTRGVQGTVLRALNSASGREFQIADLFNYGPPPAQDPS